MEKSFRVGLVGFLFIFMMMGLSLGAEREYPTKPINVIIPTNPGGAPDIMVRAMVDYYQELLGQPMIPINKTGSGGLVGGNAIATAKPDGYTIGILYVAPSIPEVFRYFQEPPYKSADLKPICKIADFVGCVLAKSDAPWNNFKDLIDHVKKNPGVKYSTLGMGTPFLFMTMIASKEQLKFVHVTAISDGEMISNILGGHISLAMVPYQSAAAHVKAGTVKVLAVFSPNRFELLPQVPTLVEQGYDPRQNIMYGLFGPKDLPDPIVQKISEAAKKVSENVSYRKKIETLGIQASFESSAQFRENLERHKVVLGEILKGLGFVKE